MKKKSPRGIPDFSSKGPKSGFLVNRDTAQAPKATKPVTTAPKVKPPATSSKSGRRGG